MGVSKVTVGSNQDCPTIEEIQMIATDPEATWYDIEYQRGRYMLYNHLSDVAEEWKSDEVQLLIYKKFLLHEDYIMG